MKIQVRTTLIFELPKDRSILDAFLATNDGTWTEVYTLGSKNGRAFVKYVYSDKLKHE